MTIKVNDVVLSDATVSYLETALWSSTVLLPVAEEDRVDGCMDVDEDHPLHGISENDNLDDHFGIEDCSEDLLLMAGIDVSNFFDYLNNKGLLERAREFADDGQIAHDFWLTRNGHGAGFWDGDYDDRSEGGDCVGRELTDAAKAWPSVDLWVDEDGKVC